MVAMTVAVVVIIAAELLALVLAVVTVSAAAIKLIEKLPWDRLLIVNQIIRIFVEVSDLLVWDLWNRFISHKSLDEIAFPATTLRGMTSWAGQEMIFLSRMQTNFGSEFSR